MAVKILLTLFVACSAAPVGAAELSAWNDTETTRALVTFVTRATVPGTTSYVEPADRVAVFDFDGTISVEAPVYGQVIFSVWRLERRAKEYPPERVDPLLARIRALPADRLNDLSHEDHVDLWGMGLAGASGDAVRRDAREWFRADLHPRLKRPREELMYEPMRELIRWLQANEFKVFIVTGSTLDFVRSISEDLLGVGRENVIGSLVEPRFSEEPPYEVVREPKFREMIDKANKVLEIDRRIGRRPLMAFGNSDGDVAMLTYAAGGPRQGFSAFVHHDDPDREYAYDRGSAVGALDRGLDVAAARGLRLISMKRDWKRLFR